MEEVRKCPACGKTVRGRADKKFCSDECRTFYNNAVGRKKRQRSTPLLKQIREDISVLEKANAKFLLRILAWNCKVFKILSNLGSK